tara:strand:+ start:2735 stop:4525 length:1791 start_codon:yes stop_codon:yes gene_type:complete
MIDLQDKDKRGRLLRAIKQSRSSMEPFRRVRKELIKDYTGSWYSENGASNKTLTNLINQTARIYTVALAANNPQVLVSTPRTEVSSFAREFEVNLNQLISDMNMEKTFRQIVLDAFFCIGCGVVMMRDTDTRFHGMLESEEDVWLDPGEPWLNRVSLDDLILDMPAKELSKMRYSGHRYRADFEKVKEEPGYNKKVREQLTPTNRRHKDMTGATRDIASGEGWPEDDDLKDMIWLQDIWIPENNSIVTMTVDDDLPPLLEREWMGSQGGPYKFLSLGDVPDNIIPASPAVNLKGMHDLQNRLHRRMEEDSDAHRVVNAYNAAGADDAEKIRTAKRNSWVRMNDPNAINQVEVGGVDQRDIALASFIQGEYDRFAGNLQAMGGLGAQASTVGQEEIIQGGVQSNVADMRMSVVSFASECILDLGRLMWEDQTLEIQTSLPIGRTGIEVSSNWEPGKRDGEFEDYRFKVEPYSMVFRTPERQLAEIYELLTNIAPLWPMFQASGASLDAEAIVDAIARLKNRPEFRQFITFANPADMLGGDQNTIRQSPVTSRETVRRNVPTGGTEDARSNILQQVLMGQSGPQVNNQQAAAMTRGPA